MMEEVRTGIRLMVGTLAVCALLYPGLLVAVGEVFAPAQRAGSLLRGQGAAFVGSRLVAQEFRWPAYLWPRPSAAGYDGAAAAGSNLAAGNPALAERAREQVARLLAAEPAVPRIPGELVAASGSGLDPHVTLAGALYQAPRIARARGVELWRVEEVLRGQASAGTPWRPPLVVVLEANLALDRNLGPPGPR